MAKQTSRITNLVEDTTAVLNAVDPSTVDAGTFFSAIDAASAGIDVRLVTHGGAAKALVSLSGNAATLANNLIAFGTGKGLSGNTQFEWLDGASLFQITASDTKQIFIVDAAAANRLVEVFDSANAAFLLLDTKLANRLLTVTDAAANTILEIDSKTANRVVEIIDQAGKDFLSITANATRLIEIFDDAAVPALLAKFTGTVAGLRRISVFDDTGTKELIQIIAAAAANRAISIRDDGVVTRALMTWQAVVGVGTRLVSIGDENANVMRIAQAMAAARTIQDKDETGVVTHTATLLNAGALYQFAPVAGSHFNLDVTNKKFGFFAADGVTLKASLDWATGRIGQAFSDTGVNGAGTANTVMGTYTHAAGAGGAIIITCAACVTGSQVFPSVQTNDATLKSVNVIPGNGSFTSQPNAAATGNTKVAFLVVGPVA